LSLATPKRYLLIKKYTKLLVYTLETAGGIGEPKRTTHFHAETVVARLGRDRARRVDRHVSHKDRNQDGDAEGC